MFGFGANKINQDEAYELMKGDVIILDVREENEFRSGKIKGAINIPMTRLDYTAEAILTDKQKTILVYCHSGGRSRSATNFLKKLGYENVKDFGGIISWKYDIEA